MDIVCGAVNPLVESHHDLIVSSFFLPYTFLKPNESPETPPVIDNTRVKTIWSDGDIKMYKEVVNDNLENLRKRWLNPESRTSSSLLLELSSQILKNAAISTNRTIALADSKERKKSLKIPKVIRKSHQKLLNTSKSFSRLVTTLNTSQVQTHQKEIKNLKLKHRKLVRNLRNIENIKRDKHFYSFLSDPSTIQQMIRSAKASKTSGIQMLKVGNVDYVGEHVKTGFFHSISSLKIRDSEPESELSEHILEDYKNILEICKTKKDIPRISLETSASILRSLKSKVTDFFSITSLHYLNAGTDGIKHFHALMNLVIDNINNASLEELNSVYALLLHKGHGKPKNSSSAYRTISSCPLVSKALDLYIKDLNIIKWSNVQALTQYQGEASSHDLAALLVTELIQHSLFTLKMPAYLLFLDAKSAYDTVKPEILARNLYMTGMDGNSLTFINERLTNRKTYLDWNKTIMGPINDTHGLEQGGISASELYKIYNNELFTTTHDSGLGIDIGIGENDEGEPIKISSVGQADDSVLSANKISNLANILLLTKDYCDKYHVKLCEGKTKLLRITNCCPDTLEQMNPIKINEKEIEFSESAEHVGIIRSNKGNLPNLLNRFTAHRRSLAATLFTGLAQKHRGNPIVGLRIERVYGTPVLMSGLASLVLLGHELNLLEHHYKKTYQNLQKLHQNTPSCVVYFLGGCLPGTAVLHLKQLSIFGMVTRSFDDPLNSRARKILIEAKKGAKSWFLQLRDICLQYNLPHPLTYLENPLSKDDFKKITKAHVINYWETKLRGEASMLTSLLNFDPNYMSLTKPHPIWSTPKSNPHEISKAIQQARFLSGRYRTEMLTKHWNPASTGCCKAPGCKIQESVEHILLDCQQYTPERHKLVSMWLSTEVSEVYHLVLHAFTSKKSYLLQFILDCSILPEVIQSKQKHGDIILNELFRLTRTWCFNVHRARMKMLGRWSG